MLYELTDTIYVAPEEVSCVEVRRDSEVVDVHLKSGLVHRIGRDYGKGVYQTQRRIVDGLNDALQPKAA